jgi:Tfp pilus assembly protein PilN
MRPVNLIPPEERRGEHTPARTGPLAYVVVGVLAAGLLGVSAVVLTGNQISDRKAEIANLEAQQASLQQQSARLSSYTDFASLKQARVETVTQLSESRFDWERVLREIALVIPNDMWLTDLTGQVSSGDGTTSTTAASSSSSSGTGVSQSSIAAPSLHMSGCAASHDAVARFAASLKDVDGVTRVVIDSSERPGAGSSGTAAPAPTGTATGTTGCAEGGFDVTFEITAAFDEAVTAATTGTTAPPAPGTTTPPASTADQSQVSDAQQQEEQQRESTQNQTQKARDNVDNIVPGMVAP